MDLLDGHFTLPSPRRGTKNQSRVSKSPSQKQNDGLQRNCSTHFGHVDRQAAVKRAQHGQLLLMSSDLDGSFLWRTRWRHLVPKRFKRSSYYFVVTECRIGHSELRWDPSPEKAVTTNSKGCILLSEVLDVAATVIHDDADASLPHSRKFRVFYGSGHVNLWAPDRESMQQWVVALIDLMRQARGTALRAPGGVSTNCVLKNYICNVFNLIDVRKTQSIRADELGVWLQKLNVNASKEYVHLVFDEFDKDRNQGMDLDEFTELFHVLTIKEALLSWFEKYAILVEDDEGVAEFGDVNAAGEAILNIHYAMPAKRFQLFLEIEQGESTFFSPYPGIDGPQGLFQSLSAPFIEVIKGETFLTLAGFSRLMSCAENSLFDPERRASVGQDMTRPLSHYWIASSHNTYLEGHQLYGVSSLEQYMDVLLRGCRCVEIDCWDGEDGEPMVTHGWTATTRLRFQDVVRVCRDYAFATSEYPLILSLEVHCSLQQQGRMAAILAEILAETLLLHEPGSSPEETQLVSPQKARHKIIVKMKWPSEQSGYPSEKATDASRIVARKDSVSSCDFSVEMEEPTQPSSRCKRYRRWLLSCLRCLACKRRDAATINQSNPEIGSIDASFCRVGQSIEADGMRRAIYLVGKKFPKVPVLANDALCPCTCMSVNDQKATRCIDSSRFGALRKFCKQQLVRVYPNAKRVGSNNFDPFDMWLAGMQMVALNYQSLDLPILCNEGLFLNENGGSGFILKPVAVRGTETNDLPKSRPSMFFNIATSSMSSAIWSSTTSNSGHHKSNSGSDCPRTRQDREDAAAAGLGCTLEITVLSGHSLPKPARSEEGDIISPLVRVSICGHAQDRRVAETWRIVDNGFNPRWQQLFSFDVAEPSVAMLALEVINVRGRSREFLAAAAVPFSGLREGIRWVQLLDCNHQAVVMCGLLVEVRLRGPWARHRRQQRLARPRVDSSVAQTVSSGPGGLEDKQTRLHETRRASLRAFSRGFTDASSLTDGSSSARSGAPSSRTVTPRTSRMNKSVIQSLTVSEDAAFEGEDAYLETEEIAKNGMALATAKNVALQHRTATGGHLYQSCRVQSSIKESPASFALEDTSLATAAVIARDCTAMATAKTKELHERMESLRSSAEAGGPEVRWL